MAQILRDHIPQCQRTNKPSNVLNRRPILAADSSGFPTFVVATEPNGVALQVLHLNNLIGHRSEVPIVVSADVGTVTMSSRVESVDSLSESGDSRIIKIEPVSQNLKLAPEPTEQVLKETDMSDDGSIVMGDCDNSDSVDAEESNIEEEVCAPESNSSKNFSPSSMLIAEVVDSAVSNRTSKEAGKLTVSQEHQVIKPVHNGVKRGSQPAEVSKTTVDSITSQVPLVVSALSADED